ncbi:MAG: LuxR family transcriptional regulator [Chitinophagaceae bacterium]|nr:LuxR family transcriptional regulator [Chitinophagaceae bacterium]
MNKQAAILTPLSVDTLRTHPAISHAAKKEIDAHEIYKPIIDGFEKFAIGPFFWFVIDFTTWKHTAGGGAIETMTPLNKNIFQADNMLIHSITHPDDIPAIMAFTNFWMSHYPNLPDEKRPHVKPTLYFRIKNVNHEYYWVMVQYLNGILNEKKQWIYGLIIVTDISHIKKNGDPLMTILDTSDVKSTRFFYTDKDLFSQMQIINKLTGREIEILGYLSRGFSSKQIASQLGLSIKTVDNHRQNMLRKTATKSSAELVNYCIHLGYL